MRDRDRAGDMEGLEGAGFKKVCAGGLSTDDPYAALADKIMVLGPMLPSISAIEMHEDHVTFHLQYGYASTPDRLKEVLKEKINLEKGTVPVYIEVKVSHEEIKEHSVEELVLITKRICLDVLDANGADYHTD